MPEENPPLPPLPPKLPFVPARTTPPPAPVVSRFAFEPLTGGERPGPVLDALLKHPGQIIYQLHHSAGNRLAATLAVLALVGFALYGLVVGSFSGGVQFVAAPLKIAVGSLLSALICLPSLYVFSCLSGAKIRIGPLCGVLLASLALNALLLLSFSPVAWVFSQSTDSLPLMGALHLAFWMVGLFFSLRLISAAADYIGAFDKGYLRVWIAVFLLVSLQMTAALRPIIGKADTFLPREKRFFLAHWADSLQ